MSAADKTKDKQEEAVLRTAQISRVVREAVRAALPAPPEQFFTMMVPGKVVDFDKFCQGFDASGQLKGLVLPNSVQLNEAILCDDMPALSGVQLGPTGKSVSRSYATTLSKLCPAGSTTGISDDFVEGKLSASEKRYDDAMGYLTGEDPKHAPKSRINVYCEKQKVYTDAVDHKIRAFDEALKRATNDPHNTTHASKCDAYDAWVAEHYRTYNNLVQAAYMDWVTTGKKEEVEYYFAIVDNDSAMSRVEESKKSMRSSVISDTDGSSEFQKVILEPQNWAWLAKKKANTGPKADTPETLSFKISGLEKVNVILRGMIAKSDFFSNPTPPNPNPSNLASPTVPNPVATLLINQKEYQEASAAYNKLLEGKPGSTPDRSELAKKGEQLNNARAALREHFERLDKDCVGDLAALARKDQASLFDNNCQLLNDQIKANEDQITEYRERRDQLRKGAGPNYKAIAAGLQGGVADEAGVPRASLFKPPNTEGNGDSDFWTSISITVKSNYSHEATETQSTSWSAGGSVGWGLWSVSASASHSASHSNALKQMGEAEVNVSFECMRVDITRPWLRGELFYDHDLKVIGKEFISPGPMKLVDLMDPTKFASMSDAAKRERETDLSNYDLFPMYPTAFLLAANVVLEIKGAASDIQQHLSNSSNSGSASVGYGPFTITASGARSEAKTDSTCESTAAGCRITIKSPQIIGWISQIVPALPRLDEKAT